MLIHYLLTLSSLLAELLMSVILLPDERVSIVAAFFRPSVYLGLFKVSAR